LYIVHFKHDFICEFNGSQASCILLTPTVFIAWSQFPWKTHCNSYIILVLNLHWN